VDPEHARIRATVRAGTVILLNGTSSSGKNSTARELLSLLDGSWFHLPVDAFPATACDPRSGRGSRGRPNRPVCPSSGAGPWICLRGLL